MTKRTLVTVNATNFVTGALKKTTSFCQDDSWAVLPPKVCSSNCTPPKRTNSGKNTPTTTLPEEDLRPRFHV